MPDISLFEAAVLNGVVEKLTDPTDYTWLGTIPTTPSPFPVASWEVIRGSRTVAKPNTPNAEAHIVPRMGRSLETASFIYVREKKVLEPTTLHWLRAPGTLANKENAEKAAMRELKDLNQRVDNLQEWACWQAIQGSLVFDSPDLSVVVDYKIPSSHKPTASTPWSSGTPASIISDVTAVKRLISRDGKVKPEVAYGAPETIDHIFAAFAGNGASLLSDRAKDQYYQTGVLPGFLQLDWRPVDETYDVEGQEGAEPYLPAGKVVFGNFTKNRPFEMLYGPSADDDAPANHIGKFSKSWKDKDPSARQILVENNFLPVLTRPEQVAILSVGVPATTTTTTTE